jgi:hypothetical protein
VIGRLADRRGHLGLGMAAGAGGVGVGPGDGGVHRHNPLDQTGLGAGRLQAGEDRRPDAVDLPAAKQAIDGLPGAVALGHVPPRAAGPDAEPDAVDELPFRPARGTAGLLADRQQRGEDRPLRIGQVMAGTGG